MFKRILVAGLACASVMGISAVATASVTPDNMYPTKNYHGGCKDGEMGDGFCMTDNKKVTVFYKKSIKKYDASLPGRITDVLRAQYSPTDLKVYVKKKAVTAGKYETDIMYEMGDGPKNYGGITWCNDEGSTDRCDQHYVHFNNKDGAPGNRYIICHETGHAVGLTHGPEAYPKVGKNNKLLACMTYNTSRTTLGAHNRKIINETY